MKKLIIWIIVIFFLVSGVKGCIDDEKEAQTEETEVTETAETEEETTIETTTEAPTETTTEIVTVAAFPEKPVESGNVLRSSIISQSGDISTKVIYNSDVSIYYIYKLTFLNSLADMPDNAFDLSANGDGSVMAWAEPAGNSAATTVLIAGSDTVKMAHGSELYNLYIAGEGGVDLNPDSTDLFSYFFWNEIYRI